MDKNYRMQDGGRERYRIHVQEHDSERRGQEEACWRRRAAVHPLQGVASAPGPGERGRVKREGESGREAETVNAEQDGGQAPWSCPASEVGR